MRRSLLLLLGIILLSGCKSSSFVGKRVDNFTAYYNTFYNARKSYDKGLKALEKTNQPVDRTTYLPVFSVPAGSGNQQDFENAIKKSADVLRDHASSKWIDDALLLIGKSYFYQKNYFGAEQKFREVLFDEGPLQDEATFWLARTLIAREAYAEAVDHLTLSLQEEGLSKKWASMLHLALGELYVRQEQWTPASDELVLGLEHVRDNDIAARARFLLGQVYEKMGRYADAVEAYRSVERHKPLYELSYAAQLSAIRVAGQHTNPEWAMQSLRKMERDDNHYANRGELLFTRGRILQAQGEADEAFLTFDEVLYGSDANISAIRGPVHYALAELYRDVYHDYVFAAAHFDTAASALGQKSDAPGTLKKQWAPEALTDAGRQAETFRRFAEVRQRVALLDSLLYVGSLDDEAYEAFVLRLREARRDELKQQERDLERRQAEEGFRNTRGAVVDQRSPGATAAREGASFLSFDDPLRVQEGWMVFVDRWGERPLVPNWRRKEAITRLAADEGAGADIAVPGATLTGSLATADEQLPVVDVSGIPRDIVSRTRVINERAMARYELGNVLFLAMNRADSAATWYRMVIDENETLPVSQRAYYALAEVQRALGDSTTANRLYRHVVESFPESEFANLIRERLGAAPVHVVDADSVAQAERLYARAYEQWQQGHPQEGFSAFMSLAADYRETPAAPKALMAAASALTDWARADSLSLYDPVPVSVADSLLRAFGIEPVADTLRPAVLAISPDTVYASPHTATGDPSTADLLPLAAADSAAAGSVAAEPGSLPPSVVMVRLST